MFTHAILRAPGANFASGLTTVSLGVPDRARLLAQHALYARTLERLGMRVEVLEPLEAHPDAYFVEDVAVVVPEVAVISRPGALARRGEEEAMLPVLARLRPLARIEAPGTLDGGDVLVVGREVLVGLSERTNAAGAEQLARVLARHGYTTRTVPVAAGLHFKSSVSWVGGRKLLASPHFAALPELAGWEILAARPEDEYACNTLLANGTLITPAGFPDTRARLAALGMPVVELDMSEARKMDGGLTCLSLRL